MVTMYTVTQSEFITATSGARIERERGAEFWYERYFAHDGREIGFTAYHCSLPATYTLIAASVATAETIVAA
jgi:hypothetical protein